MSDDRPLASTFLLGLLVAGLVLALGVGFQPPVAERLDDAVPAHLVTSPLMMGAEWGVEAVGPGVAFDRTDRLLRRLTVVAILLVAVIAGLGHVGLSGVRAVASRSELRLHRALGASRKDIFRSLMLATAVQARDALVLGGFLGTAAWIALALSWQAEGLVPDISAASIPGGVVLIVPLVLAWAGASFLIVASGEALPGRPLERTCPLGEPFQGEVCHPGVPILQVAGVTFVLISTGALLRGAQPDRPGSELPIDLASDRIVANVEDVASLDLLLAGLEGLRQGGPIAVTSPGFWESAGQIAYAETECGVCFIPGSPPVRAPYKGEVAVHHAVSPDTFDLAGITVLEGRRFAASDIRESDPVAVVSRGFARENFEDGRAIGRRVRLGDRGGTWHTVVGVIEALPRGTLVSRQLPSEDVLVPIAQVAPSDIEVVTTERRDLDLVRTDPGIRAATSQPIGVRWRAIGAWTDWYRIVWIWLGRLALAIAVLGVVSTISRRVRECGPELAIRRALGATRWSLAVDQLGVGLRIGLVGAGLGTWASLFSVAAVYPVGFDQPGSLVGMLASPAGTMVGVAGIVGLLSAWRAATRVAT